MDLLLKWASESLGSMPGKFDQTISPQDKTKLHLHVETILKFLAENNFHATLLSLMELRKFIADNIKPETLSAEFVDFLMDSEMFDWVENSISKKEFSDFDLEGLELIGKELDQLSKTNRLIEENQLIEEAI